MKYSVNFFATFWNWSVQMTHGSFSTKITRVWTIWKNFNRLFEVWRWFNLSTTSLNFVQLQKWFNCFLFSDLMYNRKSWLLQLPFEYLRWVNMWNLSEASNLLPIHTRVPLVALSGRVLVRSHFGVPLFQCPGACSWVQTNFRYVVCRVHIRPWKHPAIIKRKIGTRNVFKGRPSWELWPRTAQKGHWKGEYLPLFLCDLN